MEKISILECSKRLGLTKQAILSRIKNGKISAEKNDKGNWEINYTVDLTRKGGKFVGKKEIVNQEHENLSENTPTVQQELKELKAQNLLLIKKLEKNQNKSKDDSLKAFISKQRNHQIYTFASLILILVVVLIKTEFKDNSNSLKLAELDNRIDQFETYSKAQIGEVNSDLYGKAKIEDSIYRGLSFLMSNFKNGVWEGQPGITALCLMGFLGSNQSNTKFDSITESALNQLASFQQNDGSISIQPNGTLKAYNTSLAILAFQKSKSPRFHKNISKAQNYLISLQSHHNTNENSYHKGGIGYSENSRPDLNNLYISLEALRKSGVNDKSEIYKNALEFITKCQQSETNEIASNASGGFVYSPNSLTNQQYFDANQKYSNHGSMVFCGLQSLIFCEIDKTAPQFQDALRWIRNNFTVKSHPGMGQVSIYFYYYTLSKALSVLTVSHLELHDGFYINWREELANELLSRQNLNGSWVNTERKYMEGNPVLATAYAINSLNLIYEKI